MASGAHTDEWLDQNVRSTANPTFKSLNITEGPLTVAGNIIASTEIALLDGLTAGTVTASKAVVVDANKDIGDFRNLDVVNLDAGASGTAGTVDVYPTTASRGKIIIAAQDHASADRSTTIQNATDLSASATITLPSATCTLPGLGLANTFSAAQTVAVDDADAAAITDLLTLKHSVNIAAATGIGAGISVIVENDTDATTESASLDFQATTVTKGTMDVDVTLKTMLGGAVSQVLQVDASDQSLKVGANATDADGVYQLKVYPVTASKGALILSAVANTGDTNVIITNAAHGQQTTVTIPDPGAASANFLLSAGAQLVAGAKTLTEGAAASAVALRLGATATEGLEVKVIDETVNLTNAVETNLTETIPSGAVILSVQGNAQTTVVGDGTGDDGLVKWGIGITADPDKYGKSADLVKNHKVDTIPDWAVLSGAEQICVKGCDAGGTAVTEKFVADVPAGTRNQVRVRIVYLTTNSLDDAA